MVVFDDFPAEKAEELMQLAGSGGNTAPAAAAQNALGQPSLTGRNGTRIPTLSSPVFTRIIAEGKAKESPCSVHTIQ